MPGTGTVKYIARASATQATGTTYAPSSTGFDMSRVTNWNTFAIWLNSAGDATGTIQLSVEYSKDRTNWFLPLGSGVDSFSITSTAAIAMVRKLALNADYIRVSIVVATQAVDAFDIVFTWDGGEGSMSLV